ncbi:hypothetical protein OIU84_001398 [Salix udensis]|uniref:Uncharacterized protein n=1 Tax=Salix udensis TaxID=889485 RepID=A0AAD6P6N8_9ROSI|nr:hypothetical protein OIU84_001398 [Salix udensis]
MRGAVWLDKMVGYIWSALRLKRIVSETLKLGMNDVRWFVMGDDDTLFFPDNLVRVLSKYDHDQYYYIGSTSESHQQNIVYNYGMAYGGGGFAISYPLAKALANLQDRCIERYIQVYMDPMTGSMLVCLSLVSLSPGNENDFYGNIFGILAAHPVTPLVSLHYYIVTNAIFPRMDKLEALEKLIAPAKLDSAALLQQSICYDAARNWTISVSWGYAVQIIRVMILHPREIEMVARTFYSWYQTVVEREGFIYSAAGPITSTQDYPYPRCEWKMADPLQIARVEVLKRPDPYVWDKAPRRNCCRILPATERNDTLVVDVGECREDEFIEDNLKTYQEQTSFVFEMCFHPDAGGGYDCLIVCLPVYSMSMATLPPVHDEVDLVSSNDSILSDKSGGL